jgi:hypothetical protein
MSLHEGLLWLMGAGAGVLAFYVLDRLEKQCRWGRLAAWLTFLHADDKRWLAFAVTGVIAVAAYLLALVMEFRLAPWGWREWANEVFSVVAAAIIASQVTHGRVVLSRRGG